MNPVLTQKQMEYLVLGLLYGATRELQRQIRGPNWDGTWTSWDREYGSALMHLDASLDHIERSGEIDEWIRNVGFSW